VLAGCVHRARACADWQNLLISLAGPLSNFVASYVSLAVLHRGAIFCAMNLVIGSINLLPLPCSDGLRAYKLLGRMTRSRVSSELSPEAPAVTEYHTGDSVERNSEQEER
jgi:Zn-dependent protease